MKLEIPTVIHPFRMEGDQSQSCCSENGPFVETRHRYQKQADGFLELPSLFPHSHPISIFLSLFLQAHLGSSLAAFP